MIVVYLWLHVMICGQLLSGLVMKLLLAHYKEFTITEKL